MPQFAHAHVQARYTVVSVCVGCMLQLLTDQ